MVICTSLTGRTRHTLYMKINGTILVTRLSSTLPEQSGVKDTHVKLACMTPKSPGATFNEESESARPAATEIPR